MPTKKKAAPPASRPARQQPERLRLRSMRPAFTVTDIRRSLAFYSDVLGFFTKDRWEEGGELQGAEVVAGSVAIMLSQDDFSKGKDRVKGVGQRLWCMTTQDVDALAGQIRARGGTIDEGPTSEWGMRYFTVTDPDGFRLTFAQER
ncbi:MAG TPA: VOC family protein [Gemmatimonadales bacterium]